VHAVTRHVRPEGPIAHRGTALRVGVASSRDVVPRVSTVDALAMTLRRRVLEGEYPPDAPLREVELSVTFGVARNSVRAALQLLVHEGLLRHDPNRGVFVPSLTRDDVADIFRLRIALEVEAVRQKIPAGDGLAQARESIDTLGRLGPHDRAASIEEDLRFHRALVDRVRSPRLSRAHQALESEIRLCFAQWGFSYDEPRAIATEHAAVLAVIDRSSKERAARTLRGHLESSMQTMLVRR